MRKSSSTVNRRTQPLQPLAYRVGQAAQVIGIGTTSMGELIRTGQLPSFTVGRCRLVAEEDLRAFVASRRSESRKRIGPVPPTPLGGDRPS